MKVVAIKLFFATLVLCRTYAKDEPKFIGGGSNVTIVEGRDATLTCSVENLHKYKVAWLRVDTQTILTIGPHVITKNHRMGVSRGDQAWALTIRSVRPSDGGQYMCQINTEPMITQTHFLHISVPPDIVDSGSSGELMVREGDSVSLHCAASGTPHPNITWRREDSTTMLINGNSASKWSGEWLNLTAVRREMNGAFLCIATNGVPPSVSKRIRLHVLCKPSARMALKMIGGYIGEAVLLQCRVEAYPAPAIHWTHTDGYRLLNGSKHETSIITNGYKHTAILKINNVSREDVGSYYCHVDNSMGNASDDITLYTLATTTVTTVAITTEGTTTTEETTQAQQPYADVEVSEESNEKEFFEDDNFVVVLSQHQMQSLDLSPSS